jgi:predicted ATP-grasp superfamily ATP-dependent carboligase
MIPSDLGVSVRFVGDTSNFECADVPSPGEVIEPDWPVMTLFAKGQSRDECLLKLRQSAERLGQLLKTNRNAKAV